VRSLQLFRREAIRPTRTLFLRDVTLLAVAVFASGALAACSSATQTDESRPTVVAAPPGPDFAALRNNRPFNVVVITLDTTRADRLGAYGFEPIETPAIDALAAEGVLFARAYSPVPLTLPAHTSLFSGTYPFDHGVHDNGSFVVPEDLTMAAEVFGAEGYATAAFIASYVLDGRWGLDQGFDTYFDDFGSEGEHANLMNEVQRPADEVVDRALRWLDEKPEGPFFVWVHLYDPHVPYAPPEPYASAYEDPYVGEIAFADHEIGRFLDELEARGERDATFVVLAGDHGESPGEHAEEEHGFFVYEASMRVPLIFSLPFEEFHGVRRDDVVSLVDVLPTLLEMNGIEAPAGMQGHPLGPLFIEGSQVPERLVYAETYYPRFHYGWSELTSVQGERYKLIISPEPELYDLLEDPAESHNLVGERPDEYQRLDAAAVEMLAGVGAGADQMIALDAEDRRKLESLGYIGSTAASVDPGAGPLATPLSRIGLFNKSLHARGLMQVERHAEAARLYEEIIEEDPSVPIAYERLGEIYSAQGRFREAAEIFHQAVQLTPDWPYAYTNLAEAQLAQGRVLDAERTMTDSLELAEPVAYSYYLLGYANQLKRDYAKSIEYFESCLVLDPDSTAALAHLATVYFEMGDAAAAEKSSHRALAADPAINGVHFILARIYDQQGDDQRAVAAYLAEISNTPDHASAYFNLAMIYGGRRQRVDEERYLERVLEIEPLHPRAALFLVNIWLERGENYRRGVDLLSVAVEQPMQADDLAAAYFRLSLLHERLGNIVLAQQYLARARSLPRL